MLYYFVLGWGFSFDIETQKQIYTLDPHGGRLTRTALLTIAVYLLTACILFATSRVYLWFAAALTVWHFFGMYSWKLLTRQSAALIEESKNSALLREYYFTLERLHLARVYTSGSWHGPRHAILSVLVLSFDFFAILSHYVTTTWAPAFLSRLLLPLIFSATR